MFAIIILIVSAKSIVYPICLFICYIIRVCVIFVLMYPTLPFILRYLK